MLEVKVCVIPDKKHIALHGVEKFRLFGGAGGIRTPDLFIANEVLSQLSYSPLDIRHHFINGTTADMKYHCFLSLHMH